MKLTQLAFYSDKASPTASLLGSDQLRIWLSASQTTGSSIRGAGDTLCTSYLCMTCCAVECMLRGASVRTADRGVQEPHVAVLLVQVVGALVRPTVVAHILPWQQHRHTRICGPL